MSIKSLIVGLALICFTTSTARPAETASHWVLLFVVGPTPTNANPVPSAVNTSLYFDTKDECEAALKAIVAITDVIRSKICIQAHIVGVP
ncbi:MAG: hypothetical protein QOI05_1536 [Bradyrhizobium sp.]|jgi:hypothetical protein|nr:hypothetical protein [Bradyrhizobium sp.]